MFKVLDIVVASSFNGLYVWFVSLLQQLSSDSAICIPTPNRLIETLGYFVFVDGVWKGSLAMYVTHVVVSQSEKRLYTVINLTKTVS